MYKTKYQEGLGLYFSVDDIYEDAIKLSDIRSKKSTKEKDYVEKYEAMKESIETEGQKQPIILRVLTEAEKEENGIETDIAYGVLAGRNRLKAIKELDQNEVLAIVSDIQDDINDIKTAAIENFARIEMTEEDKQEVVKWLRTEQNYTVREVAGILGISKSYVSKLENLRDTPVNKQEKKEKPILTIEEIKKKFTPKFIDKIKNPDIDVKEKEEVTNTLKILKNSIAAEIKRLEEAIKDDKAAKKAKTE